MAIKEVYSELAKQNGSLLLEEMVSRIGQFIDLPLDQIRKEVNVSLIEPFQQVLEKHGANVDYKLNVLKYYYYEKKKRNTFQFEINQLVRQENNQYLEALILPFIRHICSLCESVQIEEEVSTFLKMYLGNVSEKITHELVEEIRKLKEEVEFSNENTMETIFTRLQEVMQYTHYTFVKEGEKIILLNRLTGQIIPFQYDKETIKLVTGEELGIHGNEVYYKNSEKEQCIEKKENLLFLQSKEASIVIEPELNGYAILMNGKRIETSTQWEELMHVFHRDFKTVYDQLEYDNLFIETKNSLLGQKQDVYKDLLDELDISIDSQKIVEDLEKASVKK